MAFTSVTIQDLPSEAAHGSQVNFSVKVSYIGLGFGYIRTRIALVNGITGDPLGVLVDDVGRFFASAGVSHTFTGLSFMMPDYMIGVEVIIYYLGGDGYYHYDTWGYQTVSPGAAIETLFSSLKATSYGRT